MANAGEPHDQPAHGVVRVGRPACGRGDDDARSVPVGRRVTVYHAPDCALCERALEIVTDVHGEVAFDLELVDISGHRELERRHREFLPVVEIDGERVFTYFVDVDALRSRLEA